MKMVTLNANGIALSPSLVRTALLAAAANGEAATRASAHPDQIAMWDRCAVTAIAINASPKSLDALSHQKLTVAGLPLEAENGLDNRWVEFRNDANETLVRIESLAVPSECLI